MSDKIIIPIKEYPAWIDCYVFRKEPTGELTFLYREPYQKQLVNTELLKKLIKYDRTLEELQKYVDVLDFLELPEQTKTFIKKIHEKLTKDDEFYGRVI